MIATSKNKFRKAFVNILLVFNFRGITRLAVSFKYKSHKNCAVEIAEEMRLVIIDKYLIRKNWYQGQKKEVRQKKLFTCHAPEEVGGEENL